jgi:hypothetical protein
MQYSFPPNLQELIAIYGRSQLVGDYVVRFGALVVAGSLVVAKTRVGASPGKLGRQARAAQLSRATARPNSLCGWRAGYFRPRKRAPGRAVPDAQQVVVSEKEFA